MTMRRKDYEEALARVATQEDLETAVYNADDWGLDLPQLQADADEAGREYDPVKTARTRQREVLTSGFEFKVNPDVEILQKMHAEATNEAE